MSAIDQLFRSLRQRQERIIIPFVTAGDPALDITARLIAELSRRGCPLVELGVPYSDPIADGPVIQSSYTRALAKKVRVGQILETVRNAQAEHASLVVTMVSYAILHRMGLEAYVRQALSAGIHGVIVPDLLVEEAEHLATICRQHDFSLIQLVTPTTPRERALRIAETTSGFLYYVSVTGITGERQGLPADLIENVAWLRQQTPLPICVGFGIGNPEQVRLLAPVADGLIVGSAIVRQLEGWDFTQTDVRVRQIGDFVASLIAALPKP